MCCSHSTWLRTQRLDNRAQKCGVEAGVDVDLGAGYAKGEVIEANRGRLTARFYKQPLTGRRCILLATCCAFNTGATTTHSRLWRFRRRQCALLTQASVPIVILIEGITVTKAPLFNR